MVSEAVEHSYHEIRFLIALGHALTRVIQGDDPIRSTYEGLM
jgi:hypothetical protein